MHKRGNVWEGRKRLEPWSRWRGAVAQREVCWQCPWGAGPSGQLSDDSRQYLAVTVVHGSTSGYAISWNYLLWSHASWKPSHRIMDLLLTYTKKNVWSPLLNTQDRVFSSSGYFIFRWYSCGLLLCFLFYFYLRYVFLWLNYLKHCFILPTNYQLAHRVKVQPYCISTLASDSGVYWSHCKSDGY